MMISASTSTKMEKEKGGTFFLTKLINLHFLQKNAFKKFPGKYDPKKSDHFFHFKREPKNIFLKIFQNNGS